MDTEIKFRGFSEELNKWFYGSLMDQFSWGCFILYQDNFEVRQRVRRDTTGMFIGIKDKKETEIYSGDLVRISDSERVSEVVWDQNCCSFKFKRGGNYFDIFESESQYYQVVGNIHTGINQ